MFKLREIRSILLPRSCGSDPIKLVPRKGSRDIHAAGCPFEGELYPFLKNRVLPFAATTLTGDFGGSARPR